MDRDNVPLSFPFTLALSDLFFVSNVFLSYQPMTLSKMTITITQTRTTCTMTIDSDGQTSHLHFNSPPPPPPPPPEF